VAAQQIGRYRISFNDKENSVYSLERPQEFLSEKALARRTQYNIEITDEDVPVNAHYIDSISNCKAQLCNSSKWFNSAVFLCDSTTDFDQIRSFPFVKSCEFIAAPYIDKEISTTLQQDSTAYAQTIDVHNDNSYGNSFRQIEIMNGLAIHRNGFQGQGKTIAIIDAGFLHVDSSWAFRQAWEENRILAVRDFSGAHCDVFTIGSHGLMVFSTIAGQVPGKLIGTAPAANYVLLRSEEEMSEFPVEEDNWISAAEFADSMGVDIISTSLGYTTFDNSSMNYNTDQLYTNTIRITRGANIAAQKGMLLVNSAGNSGNDTWHYISAPADAELGLTVGAVYPDGTITDFSSRGKTNTPFLKPDVVAMGANVTTVSANGLVKGGVAGTSFSCPITAGIAACLWQEFPSISAQKLKEVLCYSGNRSGELTTDYGYGIPDIERTRSFIRLYILSQAFEENHISMVPAAKNILQHSDSSVHIELLSENGTVVFDTTLVLQTIDDSFSLQGLSELSAGNYVAKTKIGSEYIIQKISVDK
ncbi:MAG: S8 family serine peptidase, partial [Bacteroidales bacterium]|nr:S8 family serine peptidase [Bacteroidales bacterium]